MKRKVSKVVVLGLIEDQFGRFLISQRYEPKLPEVHLKWDLPGGTNENGETLEQTLQREILEETGLKINIKEPFSQKVSKVWDYNEYQQNTTVHCFKCELISGELHLNDHKINDLIWVSKEKLFEFVFLPTTQKFVDSV